MNKAFVVICALMGFAFAGAHEAVAQQALPSDAAAFYGQGVHSYFAGQSAQGEAYLSTAIALNANDPRAYYFRALCLMRQGRMDEARSDMQIGASVEAQQPGRFNIGMALERVQGGDRLSLEQYRRAGQMSAVQAQYQMQQSRSTPARGQGTEVLYQKPTVPLGSVLQSGSARPPVVYQPNQRPRTSATLPAAAAQQLPGATAGATDPFTDDVTATAKGADVAPPADARATVQPPVTGAAPNDNPFGDPSPRSTSPATPPQRTPPAAEDNPFGDPTSSPRTTPPTPPQTTPPAAKQAPADDNPFSGSAPQSTTPPQPVPPQSTSPATTPPADDNPFRSA